MLDKLKETLPPKRYRHSLGVCEEAVRLAEKYGADTNKAYIAGLLHDCAKGYDIETQIKMCGVLGVELDSVSLQCPQIIHGMLGAEIAKREYGIDDGEILNAIRRHTVGGAGMTLLEKIIYIADMTEKNRDFEGVKKLRRVVNKNLDEGIIESILQRLALLTKRQSVIHPGIIELWNDLIVNNGK